MAPSFPFPFYSSLIHIQVYSSCVLMSDYKLYQVMWPYQFVWLKTLCGTVQWQLSDGSGALPATRWSPPRAKVPIAADKAKTQSATHPTKSSELEQAVYSLKLNLSERILAYYFLSTAEDNSLYSKPRRYPEKQNPATQPFITSSSLMTVTQREKQESYLSFEVVKIQNFSVLRFVIYTARQRSITMYKNTTI